MLNTDWQIFSYRYWAEHAVPVILIGIILLLLIGIVILLLLQRRKMSKKLEQAVRQRTADLHTQTEMAKEVAQAKSDFLSRMSHEIRTPLNAIIGMAQIAAQTEDVGKLQTCLKKIEANSQHLLGIVNDILDFSKIEAGKIAMDEEWFSLTGDLDFVQSVFLPKAEEKNITFTMQLRGVQNDSIYTDALRLNQVLLNLISNAIKFTPPGGEVRVLAEEVLHQQGDSVYRFSVTDTGIGIEPEQAKKLFTPFTQANSKVNTSYGGTGLGLVIAKNIVTMLQGEMDLDTVPGQGSTFGFSIRVPAREYNEPPKAVGLCKPSSTPDLQDVKILVVDDVEINREIAAELLKNLGAQIDMAENGAEAVEIFCAASPGTYKAVLMDMQMPVMDGCDATRAIRASGHTDAHAVRIIAMTANVLPEDIGKAKEAGMDDYLGKPIDLEALYTAVGGLE